MSAWQDFTHNYKNILWIMFLTFEERQISADEIRRPYVPKHWTGTCKYEINLDADILNFVFRIPRPFPKAQTWFPWILSPFCTTSEYPKFKKSLFPPLFHPPALYRRFPGSFDQHCCLSASDTHSLAGFYIILLVAFSVPRHPLVCPTTHFCYFAAGRLPLQNVLEPDSSSIL